jgi:hypothetical protein
MVFEVLTLSSLQPTSEILIIGIAEFEGVNSLLNNCICAFHCVGQQIDSHSLPSRSGSFIEFNGEPLKFRHPLANVQVGVKFETEGARPAN